MTRPPDVNGRRLVQLLDLARHALAEAHREARTYPHDLARLLVLESLHHTHPGGAAGILPLLGDLITEARRGLPEGEAAEQLDEAAAYVSTHSAERIDRARAALADQPDH
ncbi:hypothetical protein [Streptomyces sp. H27-H5]|uniref:hypothetical protein n=1 Tax=Streptomyces sp. H27-H5 TaxID=2996460 RepID=UPI002271D1B3|nr:hypothetical protein [Streptomyces sp. H27-H5]MCY0961483.1 hypothetical protein [Streptomyces sp. H27-H5]